MARQLSLPRYARRAAAAGSGPSRPLPRKAAVPAIAVGLACLLVLVMPPMVARAGTAPGEWSDTIDSDRWISSTDGVKITAGGLALSEGEPRDLGEAVPGEYAVHAVLAASFGEGKVYCGTGEKGHLVEYDPDELYREGYGGVVHRGVLNSRGQAVVTPPQSRVTALAEDGAGRVYGCTSPDGHVFGFDTTAKGMLPEDLGAPPGGVELTSLAYVAPALYAGSAAGNVFSFDPASRAFSDLGRPGEGSPVNSLAVSGGTLFAGLANGRLYRMEGAGGFTEVATASERGITAMAAEGGAVYLGTGDGKLFSWSGGALNELGRVEGAELRSLAASGTGELFAGAADGHLYACSGGAVTDHGMPANAGGEPINSLALSASGVLYGGTGGPGPASTGRLFRFNAGFEEHGAPGVGAHRVGDMVLRDHKLYVGAGPDLFVQSGEKAYRRLDASPDGSDIERMHEDVGRIYVGTGAGSLFVREFTGSPDGEFHDLGSVPLPAVAVSALLKHGERAYVGCPDGRLFSREIRAGDELLGPREFELEDTLPGAVTDLGWLKGPEGRPGTLFMTAESGGLFGLSEGTLLGPWPAPDGSALRALAVSEAGEVFCGSAAGRLYSFDGSGLVERADCGEAITRMTAATAGVACATTRGGLFFFDLALRAAGRPAASGVSALVRANQSIFLGLEDGTVFCSDAGFMGDRGQVVEKQIAVFRAGYDGSRGFFYAGTYRNAHFLVVDADGETVVDRGRPVDGERELEAILVTGEGAVYGATYGGTHDIHNPAGGRLFRFDPSPEPGQPSFIDLGRPPGDDNWWISSLAEGPDGTIYGGTSHVLKCDEVRSEGRVFSYTPATDAWKDLGVPVPGQGVRALRWHGDRLYGAGWEFGDGSKRALFSYTPGSGFRTLGDAPAEAGEKDACVTRMLAVGGTVYCAQENGRVFCFEADGEYEPRPLGRPVPGAKFVYGMCEGPGNTVLVGTGDNEEGESGHLVSYDPAQGRFRDVARLEAPGQKIAHCLARSRDGKVFCGTGVTSLDDRGHSEHGGRAFIVSAHTAGKDGRARSVDVAPGLEDLGPPVAGHEEVSALCAVPGEAGKVLGGTTARSGEAELFLYDRATGDVSGRWPVGGSRKVLSICAGGDGMMYAGTGNDSGGEDARVIRFDPASPGAPADAGLSFDPGTRGVFSLAWGPDGKLYAGTGDIWDGAAWEPGRIYRCDLAAREAREVARADARQGRVTSLAVCGVTVYGGSGVSPGESGTAKLICCDTSRKSPPFFIPRDIGVGEHSITALAVTGERVYIGTGPTGHVIRFDPGARPEEMFTPYATGRAVGCLAASGGAVYGGAGPRGNLFRFVPGNGFTDFGAATGRSAGLRAMAADGLGKVYGGTAVDAVVEEGAALVRFDPNARFRWSRVTHSLDVPAGCFARVNIMDEGGSAVLVEDVADGQDISSLGDAAGLRLEAVLRSESEISTPAVREWGLCWTDLPGLDKAFPGSAYPGEKLELWGSHLGTAAGSVEIGGAEAEVLSWSGSRVEVKVPAGAGAGARAVKLRDSGGRPAEPDLEVQVLEPMLEKVVPPRREGAYPGEKLELWGSHLGTAAGWVEIGGAEAEVLSWSGSRVEVKVPAGAGAGARAVKLRDSGGRPAKPDLEIKVLAGPELERITPASGGAGDFVTLEGRWFLDSGEECGGSVRFNGADAARCVSWGDTSIKVEVPAGAITGPVEVRVNDRLSNRIDFTVEETPPAPLVRIVSPAGGATVSEAVTVEAEVTGEGVTAELWVDGVKVATDSSAPYEFAWDPASVPDGARSLLVRVSDASGRRAEDSVSVYANRNVPGPSRLWHFAEGCTDYGFETWLLVQNPGGSAAAARARFMDQEGRVTETEIALPPGSRATLNAEEVAGKASFAIEVSADRPVLCERSMYWGGRTEGHVSLGATSVARSWYFAEGCTDYGFETFLLLSNPGDRPVVAELNYLYQGGGGRTVVRELAPRSRVTVDASRDAGRGEFSVAVEAGAPGIVAERSMYRDGRRCGTGAIGCRVPSTTWFLAEGSTDWGFETWLLLMNPGDADGRVTADFFGDDGTVVRRTFTVRAGSRFTVNMFQVTGTADASVRFTSDAPIVCERSMYWNGRAAGHASIGSPGPDRRWHLAEGCTDYGFETWVLIVNTGDAQGVATVVFSTDDGRCVTEKVALPSRARVSVNAGDYVPGSSFSTSVSAGVPVVVERAMYWSGRGGGTGSIGAR